MIHPIKLDGLWSEGYAIDRYILSSQYIGEDPFGHAMFKNQYSEIGNLLYSMKYNGHIDTSAQILSMITEFMDKWLENKAVDVILPTPPTKYREIQPVFVIAEAIANHFDLPYTSDVLVKHSNLQSKDMPNDCKDLAGTISMKKSAKRKCNILLIDDLYSTGSTANECVKILKEDKLISEVYYLAIAKTKSD